MSLYTAGVVKIGTSVMGAMSINFSNPETVSSFGRSGFTENDAQLVSVGDAEGVTIETTYAHAIAAFPAFIPTDITVLEIYERESDAGIFETNAQKTALVTSGRAIGWISGINVSQNGIAMATIQIYAYSVLGTASAFADPVGAAMPAITSSKLLHTLGALSLNAATLAGVQSYGISLPHTHSARPSSGDLFCTAGIVSSGAPVITIATDDIIAARSAVAAGGEAIASATTLTLKGVSSDGVFSGSDATLTVSANAAVIRGGESASHAGIATATIMIHAVSTDGTTSGIVAS